MDWRQSQLNTIQTCPERYRRECVLKEYSGNSAASIIGTAVHASIELASIDIRDNSLEPDPELMDEWARYEFNRLVEQDAQSPNPIPWSDEETVAQRREEAAALARLWSDHGLDIYGRYGFPNLIEHTFKQLPFADDITISGTMDCATENHKLIDWKTAGKKWPDSKAEKAMQPILYAAAYETLTGVWPTEFIFVVMTRTKIPKLYEHVVPLVKPKTQLLEKMLIDYDKQVKAGIFPLNITSNLCSEVYCPFWSDCPASSLKLQAAA